MNKIREVRTCISCKQERTLKDYWGTRYEDGMIQLSARCNVCSGRAILTQLVQAQQLFYYYVECAVLYNLMSRQEASALFEASQDDIEIIHGQKIRSGLHVSPEQAETIWYNRKADILRKRLDRFIKSGKPAKREAVRAEGRKRGDTRDWLRSDEPFEFEPRKPRVRPSRARKKDLDK